MNKNELVLLLTFVLVLGLGSIHNTEAKLLTLGGTNDEVELLVTFDGEYNYIRVDTKDSHSEFIDSDVKNYNSGGFRMRGSGALLFAQPTSDDQYKVILLIKDNGEIQIQRLNNVTAIFEKNISVEKKENTVNPYDLWGRMAAVSEHNPSTDTNTTTIHPQSYVGADISKYDVPTNLKRDNDRSKSFLMAVTSLNSKLDKIHLGAEFEYIGKVWTVRNSTGIENATITLEISRDGYVLKTVETKSILGGMFRIQIQDNLIYPLFYPRLCYDVEVTAQHGNYSSVITEDFEIEYSIGTRVWEPNMDWIDEPKWDYLPHNFSEVPREIVRGDDNCNE